MKLQAVTVLLCSIDTINAYSDTITRIIARAKADNITLESHPWSTSAFAAIDRLSNLSANITNSLPPPILPKNATTSKIDIHVHAVPDFYYNIMPYKPGPKPWTVEDQLQFMANMSISHTVLSFPWPGASVYAGNESATIALARIANEFLNEVVRVLPGWFSFLGVVELPYVEGALVEAEYALGELNASGIQLFTNHEGRYLGNATLTPFFAGLDALQLDDCNKVVFIHPAEPVYPSPVTSNSNVEFYWETGLVMMDLTQSQTFHNFTNLRYLISHGGGAFPSIWDRMFIHYSDDFKARSELIYRTRLWFDSAATTFPRQIQGLLAYGIPTSQIAYGTDYPFFVGPYDENAEAVENAQFLTDREKEAVFHDNALALFPHLQS